MDVMTPTHPRWREFHQRVVRALVGDDPERLAEARRIIAGDAVAQPGEHTPRSCCSVRDAGAGTSGYHGRAPRTGRWSVRPCARGASLPAGISRKRNSNQAFSRLPITFDDPYTRVYKVGGWGDRGASNPRSGITSTGAFPLTDGHRHRPGCGAQRPSRNRAPRPVRFLSVSCHLPSRGRTAPLSERRIIVRLHARPLVLIEEQIAVSVLVSSFDFFHLEAIRIEHRPVDFGRLAVLVLVCHVWRFHHAFQVEKGGMDLAAWRCRSG